MIAEQRKQRAAGFLIAAVVLLLVNVLMFAAGLGNILLVIVAGVCAGNGVRLLVKKD